jgi:hypothetical protein
MPASLTQTRIPPAQEQDRQALRAAAAGCIFESPCGVHGGLLSLATQLTNCLVPFQTQCSATDQTGCSLPCVKRLNSFFVFFLMCIFGA